MSRLFGSEMASNPLLYETYTEYIGSILPQWPEYLGLYNFLQEGSSSSGGHTRAHIIDYSNNKSSAHHFEDAMQFRHALGSRSPDTETRLILVHYEDITTMQRSFIDAVGLQLDINPLFISKHLSIPRQYGEEALIRYEQLSSQRISLEIGHYPFLHGSVLFLQQPEGNQTQSSTVLILLRAGRNSYKSAVLELERPSIRNPISPIRRIGAYRDFADRFCVMLSRWPLGRVDAANKNPVELLYPLYQLLALEFTERIYNSSWRDDRVLSLLSNPNAAFRLKGLDYDFKIDLYRQAFEMDVQALRMTIDTLRSHSKSKIEGIQSTLASPRWQGLLQDYENMFKDVNRMFDEFEAYQMRFLNRFSVVAATKSVQQSETVGRLSILAFFFVPLSFITSLFGMNVVEFGTGNIQIWVFVVTAVALFFFMLMVWVLSGWLTRLVHELQENFSGLRCRIDILKKFAVVSPVYATLLVCFALTHSPRQFQAYLLHLGIWGVLGLGSDWEQPDFGYQSGFQLKLTKFWISRGLEMVEITKQRGWQHRSFYGRWRKKRNRPS